MSSSNKATSKGGKGVKSDKSQKSEKSETKGKPYLVVKVKYLQSI